MNTKLPKIIDTFIKACNEHNSDAYIACFIEDAVVQDEGKDINGTKAIKEWNERSTEEYRVTLDVIRLLDKNEETVLTASVSGDFEGSPVNLDYHFKISNDKIMNLKILLTEE